jgi:class 3 adenylate cyclase
MVITVALVEAGDLLEDRHLLDAARAPLEELHQRGVRVTVGWPALVPRLLATVERWDGQHREARRRLDEASAIAQREGLDAEEQRVHLERAALLLDQDDHADGEAALAAAVAGFERLGMHGWVRRGELLAERRRLPVAALGSRVRSRTILTTDVVGSTATNVRLGDPLYLEQLRVHDRIVRSRLEEFGGMEVKHTGDGVNAVFDRSSGAIRCAVAIQDDLVGWRRDEPELALEVRCGVSRGQATPLGGELRGLVQAEAARVCAHGGAGDVILSAAALADAGDIDVPLEDLGAQELRGLAGPVQLFRVMRRV